MLEALGIHKASAIAGAVGAGLAALQGRNRTRVERSLNFIAGFAVACWLPGLVISSFALKETPSFYGGLGFFLGLFGMSLCDALMQAGKHFRDLDWKAIMESWLKKG